MVADEIEIILHESLLFKPVELKGRAMALKNHHQKKVTAASSLFFLVNVSNESSSYFQGYLLRFNSRIAFLKPE